MRTISTGIMVITEPRREPSRALPPTENPMLGKLVIVVSFAAILYNLGAGLYYMMTDKGTTDRTLHALTRRIALSVGLIALVMLGIWAGWIHPHGVGG